LGQTYERIYCHWYRRPYRRKLALLALLRRAAIVTVAASDHSRREEPTTEVRLTAMSDAIFATAIILFFIVSALYVRFCDKL
jgi:hypothetical protein